MIGKMKGVAAGGGLLGLMVILIIVVVVVIPVTSAAITNQNFTGTMKTITDVIPLFLGIGTLVLAAKGMGLF